MSISLKIQFELAMFLKLSPRCAPADCLTTTTTDKHQTAWSTKHASAPREIQKIEPSSVLLVGWLFEN